MSRIDPSAHPGSVRSEKNRGKADIVPEEAAAKNAGTKPIARHAHRLPFLAGVGSAERVFGLYSGGLPPIRLGAGLLPSWIEMYRMLLELEMSEAMHSLLYPDPPPPGKNDPPKPMKSRISEHYDRQRARQIAERRAANIRSRDGRFD